MSPSQPLPGSGCVSLFWIRSASASGVARRSEEPGPLSSRTGYAVNGIPAPPPGGGIAIGVASRAGLASVHEAGGSGALGARLHPGVCDFVLWLVFVGLTALGISEAALGGAGARSGMPPAAESPASPGRAGKELGGLSSRCCCHGPAISQTVERWLCEQRRNFSATSSRASAGVFLLIVVGLRVLSQSGGVRGAAACDSRSGSTSGFQVAPLARPWSRSGRRVMWPGIAVGVVRASCFGRGGGYRRSIERPDWMARCGQCSRYRSASSLILVAPWASA
jgi:hypothetical protein